MTAQNSCSSRLVHLGLCLLLKTTHKQDSAAQNVLHHNVGGCIFDNNLLPSPSLPKAALT